jgi:hypothetical protein
MLLKVFCCAKYGIRGVTASLGLMRVACGLLEEGARIRLSCGGFQNSNTDSAYSNVGKCGSRWLLCNIRSIAKNPRHT